MSDVIDMALPLSESAARGLAAGDVVQLSGRIFTARDQAHVHMLRHGIPRGLHTENGAVYHCGPVVKRAGEMGEARETEETGETGKYWRMLAAGPTTSMRMESLEADFIGISRVRAIIGKGGMGRSTASALKERGAVYLSITGGVGALAADRLGPVKGVHLLDELGPVEAVWEFDASALGPLIVSMDSRGRSLHEVVAGRTMERLRRMARSGLRPRKGF